MQWLLFLYFQDEQFDTHYHKHLIYAGERIIALGIGVYLKKTFYLSFRQKDKKA